MGAFGNGPWKEGRATAVSLCYVGLTSAQLESVTRNHFSVGIRATVVGTLTPEMRQTLTAKNWDLAVAEPHGALCAEEAGLRARIEAACRDPAWTVWRLDGEVLDALGEAGHAALLNWLGQEHARIWCAPVRDIQDYRR